MFKILFITRGRWLNTLCATKEEAQFVIQRYIWACQHGSHKGNKKKPLYLSKEEFLIEEVKNE